MEEKVDIVALGELLPMIQIIARLFVRAKSMQ